MQVIKIRGPLDGSACKSAAASVGFAHLWLSGGGTFFFWKKTKKKLFLSDCSALLPRVLFALKKKQGFLCVCVWKGIPSSLILHEVQRTRAAQCCRSEPTVRFVRLFGPLPVYKFVVHVRELSRDTPRVWIAIVSCASFLISCQNLNFQNTCRCYYTGKKEQPLPHWSIARQLVKYSYRFSSHSFLFFEILFCV